VSLTQLVRTMHNICNVWGSNRGHHQKKIIIFLWQQFALHRGIPHVVGKVDSRVMIQLSPSSVDHDKNTIGLNRWFRFAKIKSGSIYNYSHSILYPQMIPIYVLIFSMVHHQEILNRSLQSSSLTQFRNLKIKIYLLQTSILFLFLYNQTKTLN